MGQSGGSHPTRHRTRADVEKDAVPGDVRANVRALEVLREKFSNYNLPKKTNWVESAVGIVKVAPRVS